MAKKKDLVNELIAATIDRLEKMEAFTLEQAPDLCKEIVLAEKVSIENSVIVCSVFTSVFIIGLVSSLVGIDEIHLRYLLTSVFSVAILIAGSIALELALSLRVLKVAPKAFILQKLRGM